MASAFALEFEKPIAELERQIEELRRLATQRSLDVRREIAPLEEKLSELRLEIYRNLTPFQRVQVARHQRRPYALDYINTVFTDFIELHGDRLYRDDPAIVCGTARLGGKSVVVIGQQKGRDTKENLRRNFGMPHPEGYRKALRMMHMAERFRLPVITLIDTPGAYPGLGAEERGQAEAIARNIEVMATLRTPIVAVVIGEGGSGGALALGVADRVLMFENSVYSVISPEGCAAILWKDASQRERAAEALKLTAPDLIALEVIDEIIPEPVGGAHADPDGAALALGESLTRQIRELQRLSTDALVTARAEKFLRMGKFEEPWIVTQLVEVRFKGNRKAYFEWHEPEPLRAQEPVIVESERGLDYGLVSATGAVAQQKCDRCQGCALNGEKERDHHGADTTRRAPEPTRKVVRRASAGDRRTHDELRQGEDDVRRKVREKADAHALPMKVSDAEWQWDRNKLTVFFTADKRVDFRALVRELASQFRTRIELRQIGVRDEAARLGGIGRCGRELCSATFLTELRPIGLHIAKDQRLSLNPAQISGPCGRLLCCLRFEHEFYVQSRKRFPKEGKVVATAKGFEKVYSVDIFRDRVTLRAEDGTSRIAELADLKAEMEAAAQGGAVVPAATLPPRPEGRARREQVVNDSRPVQTAAPTDSAATPGAAPGEGEQKRRRRRRRKRRGPRGPESGGPPTTGDAPSA